MNSRREKSVSRIDLMKNVKLRRKERNGTKTVARNAETLRNAGVKMPRRGKKSVCERLEKLNCSIIVSIRTSLTVSLINTRALTFHVTLKRLQLNSNYQTLLISNKILISSLNHVLRLSKTMNKNKRRMLSIPNTKNTMTKKLKREKLNEKKRKDNTRLNLNQRLFARLRPLDMVTMNVVLLRSPLRVEAALHHPAQAKSRVLPLVALLRISQTLKKDSTL